MDVRILQEKKRTVMITKDGEFNKALEHLYVGTQLTSWHHRKARPTLFGLERPEIWLLLATSESSGTHRRCYNDMSAMLSVFG